jgi:hypothetical protein
MNDNQKKEEMLAHMNEIRERLGNRMHDEMTMEVVHGITSGILSAYADPKGPDAAALFFALGMVANSLASFVATETFTVPESKSVGMEILQFAMLQQVEIMRFKNEHEAKQFVDSTKHGAH